MSHVKSACDGINAQPQDSSESLMLRSALAMAFCYVWKNTRAQEDVPKLGRVPFVISRFQPRSANVRPDVIFEVIEERLGRRREPQQKPD